MALTAALQVRQCMRSTSKAVFILKQTKDSKSGGADFNASASLFYFTYSSPKSSMSLSFILSGEYSLSFSSPKCTFPRKVAVKYRRPS